MIVVILILDDDGKNHEYDDAENENGKHDDHSTTMTEEDEMGENWSPAVVVDLVDSDGADGGVVVDDGEVEDDQEVDHGEFEEGPDSEDAVQVDGDRTEVDHPKEEGDGTHHTEHQVVVVHPDLDYRTEDQVHPYVVVEVDLDEGLVPAVD